MKPFKLRVARWVLKQLGFRVLPLKKTKSRSKKSISQEKANQEKSRINTLPPELLAYLGESEEN